MRLVHLAKRAWTSHSNTPLSGQDVEVAERILSVDEFEFWWAMAPRDQAHSIVVLRRFLRLYPIAKRAEQAACLLHDVGKNVSRLGWSSRIVATLVGPRGKRFRAYHDHERLAVGMLTGVSDERTLDIIGGRVDDDATRAFRTADEI